MMQGQEIKIPDKATLDAAELDRSGAIERITLMLGAKQIEKLEALSGPRSRSNRNFSRFTRRVFDLGFAVFEAQQAMTQQTTAQRSA